MELMEDNVYAPPKADLTRKHHDGEVTTLMIDHLQTAAKWAKFLSIIGYLFLVIATIGGLGVLFVGGSQIPMGNPVGLAIAVAVLLVCLFVIFKLCRFLQRYAYFNRQLLETNDVLDLIEAQEYFRRYIKWVGVLSLISVVVSVIAVVGMLAMSLLMRGV
ncbi:MAG: hypothetical protein KGV56_05025 [Gammaproteobacteria bacterium]|nr:hypothetical protein [Gammaproteobacteria bacterium]